MARAVRKDRHVAVQRITDAEGAIVRNELRMLIRHHAVRKDTRKSRTESDVPRVADKIWSLKQCAFIV